ncbi:MAG: ImmA/IrrE family metallo-endopeptidase [Bacteroidales bacterium]|jgi:Zn-dependent peptidase ImmA (M78 family)
MSTENTTKKGDAFENKVFDIIHGLLITDEFYVSDKRSQIFRKKGYYSESRKDNITVDISIETYLKHSDKYSFLSIIECKNYCTKGIPVDDVEEFDSKLNQIGEHNTKGIIVTNSHFQKSAINLAMSKKIGLIRINENNEVDWVNYRKDRRYDFSLNSTESKLSSEIFNSNFIGFYNQKSFLDIPNVLIEIGAIDKYFNKPLYINLPYRTETEIENTIRDFELYKFYPEGKLDSDLVCKYLKDKYKLSFNFNEDLGSLNSSKILGKLSFKPLKISISNDLLSDKNRWRFTLAHEIGHFVLHYEDLRGYFDENFDNEMTIDYNIGNLLPFNNKRLEIQANIFASRLLIPQNKFIYHVKDYFVRERINKGHLYFDWQKCNIDLTMRLLFELENIFGVSKEALKIRLISQGLLIDATDTSLQRIYQR